MKGYGMGAVQLVLGLMCLAVTVVAVVMVVRTVRRMVSSVRLGQADPTRKGPFGARFGTMFKEILGRTRMLKWGHVGVAHWFVMLGFLGLSLSVAEAYGRSSTLRSSSRCWVSPARGTCWWRSWGSPRSPAGSG
ncbi:hypothetical protein [Saccharopolyspora sp. ASAGF58]|uniref:hypothetical protein n=1 Tax=Saccharopolyspora sp. ASAGF58 TaxID=2719023 RepID=UPI001B31267F|nr:hypothetical protein [Saccharopolyspora sp. ASAGF58]